MPIDVDSSICETYGLPKEGGSRFTYTHVRGYHPLFATMAGARGHFSIQMLSPIAYESLRAVAPAA